MDINYIEIYGLPVFIESSESAHLFAQPHQRHIRDGVKHEAIMEGLESYQAECRKKQVEKKFIQLPLTWLNGKHWEDEYEKEQTKAERIAEIQRNIGGKSCKLLN